MNLDFLKAARSWPWALIVLALPATVAVWSGWVGLGSMTGFGEVHPLPGIADGFTVNSAITLPVGVEAYGAYALGVWLSHQRYADTTRRFACISSIGALVLGMAGQVAYHLLEVQHASKVAHAAKDTGRTVEQVSKTMPANAPWWIVTIVACFPVLVLGAGATLAHLTRRDIRDAAATVPEMAPVEELETVDGYALWAEVDPESAPAGNTPGNVSENARNALPWGAVDLRKRWPLPGLDARTERLVNAAAGLSSNGVPGPFPEQVNGHDAPPPDDEQDPSEDVDADTLKNARETFSAELAGGETVSVRQIMSRCRVGFDKAKKIKAVLDPE